jgi:hypothetical protein
MSLLVAFGVVIALAVLIALVAIAVLHWSGDAVITRTGSVEEAEREAKARSYGIDRGPTLSS